MRKKLAQQKVGQISCLSSQNAPVKHTNIKITKKYVEKMLSCRFEGK